MTTDNFFPEADYSPADTSKYTKFPIGDIKVRALSSAIVGYEYFDNENKVHRSKEPFEETPDIKQNESVKEFWAFIVYNYTTKRIQIMEINKKSMMDQVMNYIKNPDWGSPKGYDITINRKGSTKNDTKYTIVASPHNAVDPSILEQLSKTKIDLTELYVGGDPFKSE